MQQVAIVASFICLFLSYVDEISASCPSRRSQNTNRTMNTKMWRHAFKVTLGVLSPYQCADACLRDARCKSFNYKRKQDNSDVNECELNDIKWDDAKSGEVGEKAGSDLYDVDFERLREVSLLQKEVFLVKTFKSLPRFLKCDHSNESY